MNSIKNQLKEKIQKVEKENLRLKLWTASDIVESYVDKVERALKDPLYFGFNKFDELFEGGLRGQLGAYIGYGGTKKSLFALNFANLNTEMKDIKAIYSTMEMPKERLLDRMIDYSSEPQRINTDTPFYVSASKYLKYNIKNGNGDSVREILKNELENYYGKRLLISEQTRMTIDDYRRLLDREKPDVLIVDGLSRMGGQGTETEVYSKNSGDLKDLVNEYDCHGALICHCSKTSGGISGKKDTRDLSRFVRGSEKILDNCDFILSFSLVQDDNYPDKWDTNYGWIRLEDKRNTGEIIDQIYQFDKHRLMMQDCDLEPMNFEKSTQNKY